MFVNIQLNPNERDNTMIDVIKYIKTLLLTTGRIAVSKSGKGINAFGLKALDSYDTQVAHIQAILDNGDKAFTVKYNDASESYSPKTGDKITFAPMLCIYPTPVTKSDSDDSLLSVFE